MTVSCKVMLGLMLGVGLGQNTRAQQDLSRFYPAHGTASLKAAKHWESAFVSGNGRMGAMLFGNPSNDVLIANHCRLFLPLGNREIVPDLARYVPELRRIISEKGYGDAMGFFLGKAKEQGYPGIIPTDPFHPGLFIRIHQRSAGTVTGYVRTENFATGEVEVRWKDFRGEFRRRMFVSRTDNMIVLSLTGPAAGTLDCELQFPAVTNALIESLQTTTTDWVTYHNLYTKGKGGFDTAVRIVNKGGTIEVSGEVVKASGVDEILLFVRIVPWKTPLPKEHSEAVAYSLEHPDFKKPGIFDPVPPLADSSVVAYLKVDDAKALLPQLKESLAGVCADYGRLFVPHAREHGALFDRVTLDLGGGDDRMKTSEELFTMAGKGKYLPAALMEKMYDAGRYMFISCSGELPPNLQGIWSGSWTPAWSGDFTLDTNIQAAMASALSANLPELMEGYFRLMESFYSEWQLNAKRIYGCRGFLCNARASNTCLLLHWGRWQGVFWTAGCGWLASFFSDYAKYTGDRKFLEKRCVPLLKNIAEFYEDFLTVTDKDGRVVFIPSYNPETGPGINATMDIAVARDVLNNLITTCRDLNIEQDNISRWEALLARLPAYPVNMAGALSEWPTSKVAAWHRHHSQLYPCFQSFDPVFETTPTLWKAAQATVRTKIAGADGGGEESSFGRMQCGVSAAWLRMPEEAYGRLTIMAVKCSMTPSLMTSHDLYGRTLNADGNGAIPQMVNMMLIFSQPGRLDLLPALPVQWPKGTISGMLARGQITIDKLAWNKPEGKVELELTSGKEQEITLSLPDSMGIKTIQVTSGRAVIRTSSRGPASREVSLKQGKKTALAITF